ncbi:hypothetical protein SBA2_1010005 [Acidobacteriia bacterium SbA2]|nr:hypothetical protein SBA2_1010005 [Acidobacteriia bacterium SbA2]
MCRGEGEASGQCYHVVREATVVVTEILQNVALPSRRLSWGRPAPTCEGRMSLRQAQGKTLATGKMPALTTGILAVIISDSWLRAFEIGFGLSLSPWSYSPARWRPLLPARRGMAC